MGILTFYLKNCGFIANCEKIMSNLFTFIYTAFKSDQKYHPEFNGSFKQNFPKIFSSEWHLSNSFVMEFLGFNMLFGTQLKQVLLRTPAGLVECILS